jgi:hypothetical protein
MDALLENLGQFLSAGWDVLISLGALLLPWTPLAAWVLFWLAAVNWSKLWPVLKQGGLIGVVLIGLVMVLVWGVVAPPEGGVHHLLGLKLSNFVGKTVYVTALFVIAFLCGSVQLSGVCCQFPDEPDEPEHDHGHDHGHGHGSHDHGHAASHAHSH